MLGDLYSVEQRVNVSTVIGIAFAAGISFGQLFAGTVGAENCLGWRAPFLLIAIPFILCGGLMYVTYFKSNFYSLLFSFLLLFSCLETMVPTIIISHMPPFFSYIVKNTKIKSSNSVQVFHSGRTAKRGPGRRSSPHTEAGATATK
jgi:MFS family permease